MGAFCSDHQIIDHNFETVVSSTSKHGAFCFYLLDIFWQNFSKIDSPGGCYICFWNETSRKIENTKYLFCFKTMEMQRRYNFVPGKMFSSIKSDFSWVLLDSRGMTCSILERKFLWLHISKIRKENFACLLVLSVLLLVANFKSIR